MSVSTHPAPPGLLLGDPAVGLLALALTARGRRRHPLPVALVVALLSAGSLVAAGAATWALCSLATRRRWSELVPAAAACAASGVVVELIYPDSAGDVPWPLLAVTVALFLGITIAIGLAIGSRRDLMASLRLRAETAEREQRARVEAAHSSKWTTASRSRSSSTMRGSESAGHGTSGTPTMANSFNLQQLWRRVR